MSFVSRSLLNIISRDPLSLSSSTSSVALYRQSPPLTFFMPCPFSALIGISLANAVGLLQSVSMFFVRCEVDEDAKRRENKLRRTSIQYCHNHFIHWWHKKGKGKKGTGNLLIRVQHSMRHTFQFITLLCKQTETTTTLPQQGGIEKKLHQQPLFLVLLV